MHVQNGIVSASMFAGDQEKDLWLPMFLSMDYWKGVTISKQAPPEKLRVGPHPSTERNQQYSQGFRGGTNNTPDGEESYMEIAERFLPMMSRDRVEGDHYWIDIGKSLYGTFDGNDRGLELWIRFTERSDNHSAEECQVLQ